MSPKSQIKNYLATMPEARRADMEALHRLILKEMPGCKLWFLDGRNAENKVVSNPNIGYGAYIIKYADGKTKEFYQVGLSANTTGISVYIMGIKDRKYLPDTYGKKLGKASVTGYCIKFKAIRDINLDVLKDAIQFGAKNSSTK